MPVIKMVVPGIILMLLLAGCSQVADAPARRIVEGKISFEGEPVFYGSIRFIPDPAGPVALAVIQNGNYRCEGKGGVPVGMVRVEIESMPNTTGMTEDDIQAKGLPKATPIPSKYNQQSELTKTIPTGDGEFNLNFELSK